MDFRIKREMEKIKTITNEIFFNEFTNLNSNNYYISLRETCFI